MRRSVASPRIAFHLAAHRLPPRRALPSATPRNSLSLSIRPLSRAKSGDGGYVRFGSFRTMGRSLAAKGLLSSCERSPFIARFGFFRRAFWLLSQRHFGSFRAAFWLLSQSLAAGCAVRGAITTTQGRPSWGVPALLYRHAVAVLGRQSLLMMPSFVPLMNATMASISRPDGTCSSI